MFSFLLLDLLSLNVFSSSSSCWFVCLICFKNHLRVILTLLYASPTVLSVYIYVCVCLSVCVESCVWQREKELVLYNIAYTVLQIMGASDREKKRKRQRESMGKRESTRSMFLYTNKSLIYWTHTTNTTWNTHTTLHTQTCFLVFSVYVLTLIYLLFANIFIIFFIFLFILNNCSVPFSTYYTKERPCGRERKEQNENCLKATNKFQSTHTILLLIFCDFYNVFFNMFYIRGQTK